jgi:radical SAM superfamily enzyme YgiQ (UPF0313 family)
MDIVFIYPHIGDGNKRVPNTRRYFPWGAATVIRCIEREGHRVSVLDIYGNDLLLSDVEKFLDENRFDLACISSFASYNYTQVLRLAGAVKERYRIPVIAGGILADLHFDLLLKKNVIDYCVIGEGERTIVDLLRNFGSPEKVNGISYRKNGDVRISPANEFVMNLDELPFPDFDLWNMDGDLRGNLWADDATTKNEDYDGHLPSYEDLHPNTSLFFGRGCPFRCRFRSRSYQNVRYKSVDRRDSALATEIKGEGGSFL